MSRESELLAILADIKERMRTKNEFSVLGIAGQLQKLLYGDLPLLEIVARSHAVELRFRVNNAAPNGAETIAFWTLGGAYYPGAAPTGLRLDFALGKNQFLCHRAMIINAARYTVMDILRAVALVTAPLRLGVNNALYDDARTKLETIFGGHLEDGLALLKAFAKVVLEAASPLESELKKP